MQSLLSYLWPWQHADLIRQMALREVHARYRQSWLGTAWLVLAPLLMLTIYTLVFKHVFQVRWSAPQEGSLAFALRIYAGLAVFNFFAEYVNRSPSLVVEQPHLVKKVLFPVQILPWSALVASGVHLAVASVVMLLLRWLSMGSVPWTVVCLPLIWLPLCLMCLGLGWAFAGLGVYARDIGQLLSMAMSALVFLSPVFFPVEVLPRAVQEWMWLNPLAPIMSQTRAVLLLGQWPDWQGWAWSCLLCLGIAVLGAALFRRLKPGFADVL